MARDNVTGTVEGVAREWRDEAEPIHPLARIADLPEDLARNWIETAERWRRMSPADPIAATLEYCARELLDLIRASAAPAITPVVPEVRPLRVYAIRRRAVGEVKIGISTNPLARLLALQSANGDRLELAALVEGDRGVESQLHRRFAAHRKHGEWFHEAPEITAWIEEASNR